MKIITNSVNKIYKLIDRVLSYKEINFENNIKYYFSDKILSLFLFRITNFLEKVNDTIEIANFVRKKDCGNTSDMISFLPLIKFQLERFIKNNDEYSNYAEADNYSKRAKRAIEGINGIIDYYNDETSILDFKTIEEFRKYCNEQTNKYKKSKHLFAENIKHIAEWSY
jgi:hypothetical protein